MTVSETYPIVSGGWHDTRLSHRARAESLLKELSLEEKVAQLGSSWPGSENLEEAVAPLQESHLLALPFSEAIRHGLGHITRPFGTAPIDPEVGIDRLADLQRQVISNNRFGIPAIAHEECLTGLTAWRATVFPTPLAWAASFNPDLVTEMAASIGEGMAALGVHQGLSPVLDVVRDYRWGRVEETLGEDPYLVSELATAYVTGLQSAGVIATLKHFAGYSASRGARNHAPVGIGNRELRDVILPPFEKAVVRGGARAVMNSYTEIDGVPSAADETLLTRILRDEWGFSGTVVSDYWAIAFLSSMHRVVEGFAGAGALALTAGIDVELPHTLAYTTEMAGLVESSMLDRAVVRVLTQKAELGLLDADWRPERTQRVELDSDRNRAIAEKIAEQSIVLLKNGDGILPFSTADAPRIAVIGPVADDPACLFGCYSFPNHVLPNFPDVERGVDAPSILEALTAEFPGASVVHARGAEILTDSTDGLNEAVDVARRADLIVLVVGDRSGMFGHGSSGEGCDVLGLDLPGSQDALAEAVFDLGIPTILLLVTGRPYAIGRHADRADAVLQAFFPGQRGASAIAGVMSGRVGPSGRLPVQIPGEASAQPGTYLAPPLALRSEGISNIDPSPRFPFGFGLSFTEFEFGEIAVTSSTITTNGVVEVTAVIRNRGGTEGVSVPQLYLSDPSAEVTRPVRQLIGFGRVTLGASESATVRFTVSADLVAYTGLAGRRQVDPGDVVFTVAQHADDPGLSATVLMTGARRYVDHTREMTVGFQVERSAETS